MKRKKNYIVKLKNIINFIIIDSRRNIKNEIKLYIKKLL